MDKKLILQVVVPEYAITRLNAGSTMPEWVSGPGFWEVSNSKEEMTLVCRSDRVPSNIKSSGGWKCVRVEQRFTFEEPGVLASVLLPLANAGVSIFTSSTFSTDYIFVAGGDLHKAVDALRGHGHEVRT